jgi:hypothetical protein
MKRKPSVYQIIVTLILVLIIGIGSLILFVKPERKTAQKPDQTINEQPVEKIKPVFRKDGELRFLRAENQEVVSRIEIEVASNDAQREQGMMYRDTLAENAGMLFMMGVEEMQAFWMKNTIISLDIIFVDSERRIVSIHKNCVPYSLEQIYSGKPAMFVVEVNAGYTDKYDIKPGDIISF